MLRAASILAAIITVFVAAVPCLGGPVDCDACKIILLDASSGAPTAVDTQIAQTQNRIKSGANVDAQIERLGWLFVEKARVSNDPGFYKLAEQCAVCLEAADSNSYSALLLRGHVLHSLHNFKEAEPLALDLTRKRGLAFDFGLLGDIEYDEGKIPEAVAAYQRMADLRPDLEAYGRVAQVRWITGDLTGAIEAMTLAADAGSPLNAEPTAWTYARLATLQLQAGDFSTAQHAAEIALQMQSNNAPALVALGRAEWAQGEKDAAIAALQKAAALNRLPETQWLLADALRATGKTREAEEVEATLEKRGVAEDPRSFALYLATRGMRRELALNLAQRELEVRSDVFTHDALAWALQANGRNEEASAEMTKALAEGTQDARLFFHAAVIAGAAGQKEEAARTARLAWSFRQMLYPSELERLKTLQSREEFSQQNGSGAKPE